MQTPRRVLAFIAAVTILSGTLTPVYANEVDIDISGLLDDDVTLGLSVDDVTKQEQGSWYNFEDGTLTLFGQLPDTDYGSFAALAGIDAADVKKVVIARDTTAGTSLHGAFDGFSSLESIEGLEYLDTSSVTDMRGMFMSCSSLTSLDLSGFDTSNVTAMYGMF
ncbi:MAG: BspA family leucine-rich repeat surface protein, partial [Oscillospiraceae bacterium]|nr:BspA family leucine-rich repeat surface protein [Oscillospiraceae bacterium]